MAKVVVSKLIIEMAFAVAIGPGNMKLNPNMIVLFIAYSSVINSR